MAQLPTITLEIRFPWQSRALIALMLFALRLGIKRDFRFVLRDIARRGVWMRVGSCAWSWMPLPL